MVVPVPSVFSRPERSLNVWDLLDTQSKESRHLKHRKLHGDVCLDANQTGPVHLKIEALTRGLGWWGSAHWAVSLLQDSGNSSSSSRTAFHAHNYRLNEAKACVQQRRSNRRIALDLSWLVEPPRPVQMLELPRPSEA